MMTRDDINTMLETIPFALERAILFLYNEQTADEKASSSTTADNGRGFNSSDARYGSFLARYLLDRRTGQFRGVRFTGKHRPRAMRIAKRYAGQLLRKANEGTSPEMVTVTEVPDIGAIVAVETERRFRAEAVKEKFEFDPKTMDARFYMLELD